MWVRFPPSALAVECINKLKSFSWPVCAHRQINWPQLGTLHLIGRHYTAFMDYDKAGARRADDGFTETPSGATSLAQGVRILTEGADAPVISSTDD